MKCIATFLFSLLLLGCSSSPGYYRSPPDTCDGALGCAVSAVVEGVIYSKPAPAKCAEMRGEQKQKCIAQVEAVKRSIKKAQDK